MKVYGVVVEETDGRRVVLKEYKSKAMFEAEESWLDEKFLLVGTKKELAERYEPDSYIHRYTSIIESPELLAAKQLIARHLNGEKITSLWYGEALLSHGEVKHVIEKNYPYIQFESHDDVLIISSRDTGFSQRVGLKTEYLYNFGNVLMAIINIMMEDKNVSENGFKAYK